MTLWDHLSPGDLYGWNPWICNTCGYRVNGGRPVDDEHECDPRSVVRVQSERRVSAEAVVELERWINMPARRLESQ